MTTSKFGAKLLSDIAGVVILSSDNPLDSYTKNLLIVPIEI